MTRIFAVLFLSIIAFAPAAQAGKAGKYSSFQATYQYVIGKVGPSSTKGKKAKSIMAEVRKGFKNMDRGAFYSLVARKEAQILGLAN